MAFDGYEGEVVKLSDAEDWTTRYRGSVPNGTTIAHFFGKYQIKDILDQEGCMGIRIYYGTELNGDKLLVLVGADADEDDMENGIVLDKGCTCPTNCGVANSLNS